jgi:aminoglycoside 2'-N-acetyltransferase I
MADVVTSHTAELDASALYDVRVLLDAAFDGELTDDDWDHTLGGIHALLRNEGQLVAHAAVVQRRLVCGGRAWRTGYLEGVAVWPAARRRGYGSRVVAAVEDVARRAYDVVALSTTEQAEPLYAGRGWLRWRGPTSALTPRGTVRTRDDDGSVYVLPGGVPLDPDAPLTCDWRDGDLW